MLHAQHISFFSKLSWELFIFPLLKKFAAFLQEGLLPYSHPPLLDPIKSIPSYLLKIHLNVILPSALLFTKCFLSLNFSHQNTACTPPPSHSCHMARPSGSWLDHLKEVKWIYTDERILSNPWNIWSYSVLQLWSASTEILRKLISVAGLVCVRMYFVLLTVPVETCCSCSCSCSSSSCCCCCCRKWRNYFSERT